MLPTLFVSHGSPQLVIMDNNSTDFLKRLPKEFEKPKYILVISAHWVTNDLKILSNETPNIIYDFYNFPRELYEQEYAAKNENSKVNEIVQLLEKNSIKVSKDNLRSGYDHGVWSPLKLMYPNADIPIIQLSLPFSYSAPELVKLGEALYPLRDETLIVSSGAMTHNLSGMNWSNEDAQPVEYASNFRDWIANHLEAGDLNSLVNFEREAPYLRNNHPSLEHFLPLFVALGASKTKVGKSLHNEYMYGNQSMDTIIFKD